MQDDPVLKVMTYNIRSCFTMNNKQFDPSAAANVIKNIAPDVCGVQEISKILASAILLNQGISVPVDCPAMIGDITGMTAEFGQALFYDQDGETFKYGIAAFSRLPSELAEIIQLPHSDNEPRVAVVLKVMQSGRAFYFITTHFSYEGNFHEERCKQMKMILDTVKEKHYTPAVITGDMNAHPEDSCMVMLGKEWQIVNSGMLTHHSQRPSQQIDYIAYYPKTAFSLKSVQLIRDRKTSDHFPIAAELYWRQENLENEKNI